MKTNFATTPLAEFSGDALVLALFEGASRTGISVAADAWIAELYASGEFTGKSGELAILPKPEGLAARRLVVAGAGKSDKFTAAEMRKLSGTVLRALKAKSMKTIALELGEMQQYPDFTAAAIEGAILGDWEPDLYKSKKEDRKEVAEFALLAPGAPPELSAAFERGEIVATAQNLTRDLVNEPGNKLTPKALAEKAGAMALEAGIECDVLDQERMKQLGMGALLGVAQGSAEPPVLIVLRYRPMSGSTDQPHLALVGKGVTFDTGGISIKPSDGMEKMKYDMAGGAAVIGAMQAIAKLKPPIAVTAFIPAVENMPGSRAQRPGDIVTSMSGKTVEVLNTDAEGRLILIDAITYAKQQGVTHMIDAATLTGAIVIALGGVNAGVFSNNEPWQRKVLEAAKTQGEKMWPLPMDDDYKELLKSAFADMPNIGARGAGSITAAKFLEEWVGDTPWCHLDIAGTAWLDDAKPHLAKGPTGVAVRTFVQLALEGAQ
ncbi:MAG: leucyl aminopeptidase [Bryobacter sp.]|nr:leucyl aminopeptidase [Bryobacter sp.]